MALSEYKKWKKRQELLETLKEFGITEDDLKYLPEALKIVKNRELQPKEQKFVPTADEKKKIQENKESKNTPQDFISQFSGEKEQFYPYGKPKSKTNNN